MVPAELEAKLLAAIPSTASVPASRHRLWWALAVGPAAAALVLAAVLFSVDVPSGPEQLAPGALGNTSPRYVLSEQVHDHSKETRPCDVLKPLPHSF
jgi:hypothetical protein